MCASCLCKPKKIKCPSHPTHRTGASDCFISPQNNKTPDFMICSFTVEATTRPSIGCVGVVLRHLLFVRQCTCSGCVPLSLVNDVRNELRMPCRIFTEKLVERAPVFHKLTDHALFQRSCCGIQYWFCTFGILLGLEVTVVSPTK